jgi:hypothetical protein
MANTPIEKHTAPNDPALKFWAEKNVVPGSSVGSWAVISQVDGFPATEAHDDWFGFYKDADEVAQQLASEAPAPDAETLAVRARR